MSTASLPRILAGLNDAGVRYVVIGGVAAVAHGSARITNDVDICYQATDDNRERLARVLAGWKARLRGVEPGLPFILDARALRDSPILTLVTALGDVDVLDRVAGVGDYDAVVASSVATDVAGVPARMLSLDALIAAKRATGRRRDKEALIELEALREAIQRRRRDRR